MRTYLKNEKGAITLFVLVSCMFFIATVVCVQMSVQSKQVSIDREYKQIKLNYEASLENIDDVYNELLESDNFTVEFGTPTKYDGIKKISVPININAENVEISILKYGWLYSSTIVENPTTEDINNWTFVETANEISNINAILNYTEDTGYYYLCLIVNDRVFWMNRTIEIN